MFRGSDPARALLNCTVQERAQPFEIAAKAGAPLTVRYKAHGEERARAMATLVVGMSGGVDSSVAAALLMEQGHKVIGVTLHLWDYERENHAGRCCAPEDQYDAKRVCDALGVPHYTFDRRELFRERVVGPFIDAYREGSTPSPCVQCNEHVKLGPLWTLARRLGADGVASGHYAQVEHEGESGVKLSVARDRDRDQSYFLFAAPVEALRALVLPLGAMTKPEVRAHGARLGLSVASKPDSTDLCFVEGQPYGDWLAAHGVKERPGAIENTKGETLGTHDGVHRFTVGQRKGLSIGGGPVRYVLRVVPERDAVVVGTEDEAYVERATVREMRWIAPVPPPDREVNAKLRYRHGGVRVRVLATDSSDRVELELAAPQRGVAKGQAAVLYDGDRVLGGGYLA